jgi:hypothetical protein
MYSLQELKTRTPRKPVLVYGPAQREITHRSDAVRKLQLYGTVKYQELEKPVFNKRQQRLYGEAVYGITMYNEAELATIPGPRRYQIIQRFRATQVILNEWKQQLIESNVGDFLARIFPRSATVRTFVSIRGIEGSMKCKLQFKDLGITSTMIAQKLVETGILPKNFFQLG